MAVDLGKLDDDHAAIRLALDWRLPRGRVSDGCSGEHSDYSRF